MTAVLLVLLLMLVLVVIGVPIGFAIMAAAFVGLYSLNGMLGIYNAALALYDSANSFPLIAIPLFVLAGALMNTSGISRRLIAFVSALIGFVRGALAMVTVGVSMFFAEISGSAVADIAAVGSVMIPAMKERGYKPEFAAAVSSSAASLAIIIPPSIPMILYAAMADTSVVKLFLAGVIPGVVGGFSLMLVAYIYARRNNLPREAAFQLANIVKTFKDAFWALLLPVIILGGIFGGFVTATEGAGLAVIAALLIGGLIYRELDMRALYEALLDGVSQTATVMLLVVASAVLGLYLTETQMPQKLAASILSLTTDKIAVLMILNVLFFFIGCILHGAAAIILVVPVVMPLINQLGIDPIHFGIIVTLNIAIGQQTPPVASVLAVACSIAKTDMWSTTRANVPFIGVLIAVLLVVTYVPEVSLGLVRWFYG